MTDSPYYHEGRIVRASDLAAEQWVARERHARHLSEVHGWGIVSGLKVQRPDKDLYVCPGWAVDGYGRYLFHPGGVVSSEPDNSDYRLCLRFHLIPVPGQPARMREGAHLVWATGFNDEDLRQTEFSNVRVVRDADDAAIPPDIELEEPDGPRPVPLWIDPKAAEREGGGKWAGFLEAGVVGERIDSPDGKVRVQVGDDPEREFLSFRIAGATGEGKFDNDRITINRSRRVNLKGKVEVCKGNLWIQPPASEENFYSTCTSLDFGGKKPYSGCLRFKPLPQPPEEKDPVVRPWSIYSNRGDSVAGDGPVLKVEIPHPGEEDNPANYRVMISRDVKEPQLTVKADNNVVVGSFYQGDAVKFEVEDGAIAEGPIRPIPEDPRYFPWLLKLATSGDMKIRYAELDRPTLVDDPESPDPSSPDKMIAFKITLENTGRLDISGAQLFVSVIRKQTWIDSDDVDQDNDTGESVTGMRPDPRFQRQIDAGLSLGKGSKLNLPGATDRYEIKGLTGAEPNLKEWIIAVLAYGSGPVGNLIYAVTARKLKTD